jgi:hypothetical protein
MIELYQDILSIAKSYMGVVAEEYIERRCRVSIGKDNPANLEKEDIERLASGIEMTVGAYINEEKAKKFKDEVLRLSQKEY